MLKLTDAKVEHLIEEMPKNGYWYLATPYTKYPGGLEAAYEAACVATKKLMREGVPVFCPIAHSHGPSLYMKPADQTDHEMWIDIDAPLLKNASGLLVAMMPGWDVSFGITHEIGVMTGLDRPIRYLEVEGA